MGKKYNNNILLKGKRNYRTLNEKEQAEFMQQLHSEIKILFDKLNSLKREFVLAEYKANNLEHADEFNQLLLSLELKLRFLQDIVREKGK